MWKCVTVMLLTAMPSLVTLILENTAVTDIGIKQFSSCAPPLLQNLDLSRTSVTQDIFVPLQCTTACLQCLVLLFYCPYTVYVSIIIIIIYLLI